MKARYLVFETIIKEKGLNAAAVSKATGIAPSTLSDWKAGRSTPKIEKIMQIAFFLGVDFKEFYSEEKKDAKCS
jgi:transcriptional regulator with XRE-family HTH domain